MKQIRKRVVAKVRDVENRARESDSKRVRASLYLWRVCVQVIRQWNRDRCPQQAAGLAFQIVLSVVPVLAVTLALFRATGSMGAESSLVDFLSREFIPLSREDISERLITWSANINIETMGVAGLITTLLIAFFTFNDLERTINHIWRVDRRRSLPKRMAVFYLSATVGPLLFGISLYQAAKFGFADGEWRIVLSLAVTFGALFLANFFLPATPVRVSAALIGAAVTTVLSELAKLGFTAYVSNYAMAKYAGVYGALAVIPLWLIWIYWSWLMMLLGIEVAHTVQNMKLLEKTEKRLTLSLSDELENKVNGPMAVRILSVIAAAELRGEGGISRARLSDDLGLSTDTIRLITNRLQDNELLSQSESLWKLAKPAEDITLLDVLDAFRTSGELAPPDHYGSSAPELALAKLSQDSRHLAERESIGQLAEALNDQA